MKNILIKYIFLIQLFNRINRSNSVLLFNFPSSITLSNGNILVIEKNGIYICNPTLETILNTVFTFSEDDRIKDLQSFSNVILKDKNYYIICMVNFKIYFLTRIGELLKATDRIIPDENPTYFTLAPIFEKK